MRITTTFLIASTLTQTVCAAVVATSGTVTLELAPFPPASDTTIYVFDEQQSVAFVESQTLNFGAVLGGTLVNSHYVQFDPAAPTGLVGTGTITFDGPIVGVITSTAFLDEDLSADGAGSSDLYFGLAGSLGPYPTGADPASRGLGSAEDDLIFTLGSTTLTIDSLEVPVAGNLDGFRVLTAVIVADDDEDGIGNPLDNCVLVANAGQRDTDGDNIGNACDPDIAPQPNDCQVNFNDLSAMRLAFFSDPAQPAWNADADFNGDDAVNFADLQTMKDFFFAAPGPSGLIDLCD